MRVVADAVARAVVGPKVRARPADLDDAVRAELDLVVPAPVLHRLAAGDGHGAELGPPLDGAARPERRVARQDPQHRRYSRRRGGGAVGGDGQARRGAVVARLLRRAALGRGEARGDARAHGRRVDLGRRLVARLGPARRGAARRRAPLLDGARPPDVALDALLPAPARLARRRARHALGAVGRPLVAALGPVRGAHAQDVADAERRRGPVVVVLGVRRGRHVAVAVDDAEGVVDRVDHGHRALEAPRHAAAREDVGLLVLPAAGRRRAPQRRLGLPRLGRELGPGRHGEVPAPDAVRRRVLVLLGRGAAAVALPRLVARARLVPPLQRDLVVHVAQPPARQVAARAEVARSFLRGLLISCT